MAFETFIDSALAPLYTQDGWHGMAYGMLFFKTIHAIIKKLLMERLGLDSA